MCGGGGEEGGSPSSTSPPALPSSPCSLPPAPGSTLVLQPRVELKRIILRKMVMLMMLMLRNHMSYSKANSITASSHTSPRVLSISVKSYHFKILTKQNLSLRLCGFLKKTLFASRARPRAKRKMAITPGVYVFYGTHGGKILVGNHVFSVMRCYRTRVCK